jgi:hypothetical protein
MTSTRSKLFLALQCLLLLASFSISGCATYIASRQDDILSQINIWAREQEYSKAFETIGYVKPKHPQYQQLEKRKLSLLKEASNYEISVEKKIHQYTEKDQWAAALDLMDEALDKYTEGKTLQKTRELLINQQQQKLVRLDEKITRQRSLWMIATRPVIEKKLVIDPRNEDLKEYVQSLQLESEQLAAGHTQKAQAALKAKQYAEAKVQINKAIALAPTNKRKKILARLTARELSTHQKKKQKQKLTLKKKHDSTLIQITKNFQAGNLLKTKKLIATLSESQRESPELIHLELQLDQSIRYVVQRHLSNANKLYTAGKFHQAIQIWETVLLYDPANEDAKKNIIRANKVIDKLSDLREKQQN